MSYRPSVSNPSTAQSTPVRRPSVSTTYTNPVTPSPLRMASSQMSEPQPQSSSGMPLLTEAPSQDQSHENTPQTVHGSGSEIPARPAAVTRISTENIPNSPSPVRRVGPGGNEMTFWTPNGQSYPAATPQLNYPNLIPQPNFQSPVPQQGFPTVLPQQGYQAVPQQTYQAPSFELHRTGNRNSVPDFNNYGDGPHPIQTTEGSSFDETGTSSAVPLRKRSGSNNYSPRHQKASSMRSIRFDNKRNQYHFDTLSDIDSEQVSPNGMNHNGTRGGGSRQGGYRGRRESTPPEDVLRLPLTWWMNSNAKNRKSFISAKIHLTIADLSHQTLLP